jgi:hypothetical protein
MRRDIHVYDWDAEPSDERPSEFARSTSHGGLYSTQHGGLYSTRHGGFYATQQAVADAGDSTFTRPSPLARDRVRIKPRFRELPVGVVLVTILGGAAYLLFELARILQR